MEMKSERKDECPEIHFGYDFLNQYIFLKLETFHEWPQASNHTNARTP